MHFIRHIILLSILFAFATCLPAWYALQEQILDGCDWQNSTFITNTNQVNGATDSQGRVWILGGRNTCRSGNVVSVASSPSLRYFDVINGRWTAVWSSGDSAGPIPRSDNSIWIDKDDNIWVYGGLDNSFNILCDFWMYNSSSKVWTELTPQKTDQVFGDRGVESSTTYPGCLRVAATWYTHDDNSLWLSHGYSDGYGLPAMFRYKISSGMWTWMGGSNTTCTLNQFPDAGSSFNNYPCVRYAPVTAVDDKGNLWFFGGDVPGFVMNDLWKFDRASGWERMAGGHQQGGDSFTSSYGTSGQFSAAAWPQGATYTSMAYAGNNILALKGGYSDEVDADYGDEEWYYNITSNQWMNYHNGTTNTVIQALGQADPLNRPGVNMYSRVSSMGALWVIGDMTGSVFLKKLSCDSIFNPCNEHATCTPSPVTAATCACNEGFTGDGYGPDGCVAPSTPTDSTPSSSPTASTTPSTVPKAATKSTASQCWMSVVVMAVMIFAL